jgi:hypothetical protein
MLHTASAVRRRRGSAALLLGTALLFSLASLCVDQPRSGHYERAFELPKTDLGEVRTLEIAPDVMMPLVMFGGITGDDVESHRPIIEGAAQVRDAHPNKVVWKLLGLDTAMNYGETNSRELSSLLSSLPLHGVERSQIFLMHKIEPSLCPQGMHEEECTTAASRGIAEAVHQLPGPIDILLLHSPCDGANGSQRTLAIWRAMEAAVSAGTRDEKLRVYYDKVGVTSQVRAIGTHEEGCRTSGVDS